MSKKKLGLTGVMYSQLTLVPEIFIMALIMLLMIGGMISSHCVEEPVIIELENVDVQPVKD
jgi:hypothetical protein